MLAAALRLADSDGIEALSMRRLGEALGVEAMSLYKHVANKDAILDGLADLAIGEIELPRPGEDWRPAMERRAHSARAMLERHPWALGLLESREHPGPQSLRYYEGVIACLREAGFSLELTAHAFSAIDSYVYGFALQHKKLPFETAEELALLAEQILAGLSAEEYPHFHAFTREHVLQPEYDFAKEFAWGLQLVLDGIERRAEAEA